jgi:hypothetical protein
MLKKLVTPDLQLDTHAPEIGFLHRKLSDADIYFVANTSNHNVSAKARFGTTRTNAEQWDPFSGKSYRADARSTDLTLAPYESRVLVFDNTAPSLPVPWHGQPVASEQIDLGHDWQLTFPGLQHTVTMQNLRSWTDDEATRYFSGKAQYTRDFDLPAKALASGHRLFLNFGEGKLLPPADPKKPGTHALLESSIREVAIVSVNGQKAGSIWRPPYRLDVTPFLHAGTNHLEIEVANTAINTLAGLSLPDYRLLNLRYGQKFVPQDMDHLEPLPSGILGCITLVSEEPAKTGNF